MASVEVKPIGAFSWSELAISAIFTWLAHKMLDFFWNKARPKMRLEGRTHLVSYLFVMFGNQFLMVLFGCIIGVSKAKDISSPEFEESVNGFLQLHRRYHQLIGGKPCAACSAICLNRMFFERFISDPSLARARSKQFSKQALDFQSYRLY